jgi:hypothetical protein
MPTYSIGDLGRRDILKISAALAGSGAVLPAKLAVAETGMSRISNAVRLSLRGRRLVSVPFFGEGCTSIPTSLVRQRL